MITPKEKKRIIEVLGKHYSTTIINHLQTKEIVNAKGNPFSQPSIRNIVNCNEENITVELAILQLVDKTEKSKIKIAQKRKLLIAKK